MTGNQAPDEIRQLADRMTKLEAEKGTDKVLFEGINRALTVIQEKLDKAIVYNEKHDSLSREVDLLRKDYSERAKDIDTSLGFVRGALWAGVFFAATITSLSIWVAKDALTTLKEHQQRIDVLAKGQEVIQSRLNTWNPKQP